MGMYAMAGDDVSFIAADGTAHVGVVIEAHRFTEIVVAHDGTRSYVPWDNVVVHGTDAYRRR
jgi:hypothetical protein